MYYFELTLLLLNITRTWTAFLVHLSPPHASMERIASYQAQASTPGHNSQHSSQETTAGKQPKDQARQNSSGHNPVLEFVSFAELVVESPRYTERRRGC
jgi:hypothetical protein